MHKKGKITLVYKIIYVLGMGGYWVCWSVTVRVGEWWPAEGVRRLGVLAGDGMMASVLCGLVLSSLSFSSLPLAIARVGV